MKPYFLFDFDGVVIDSFHLCYELSQTINSRPDLTHGAFRDWFNGNVYKHLDVSGESSVVAEDDPFFVAYKPRVVELSPVPGIQKVLETICEITLPPSIISSTPSGPIRHYLAEHGLTSFFERIYGADMGKHKIPKMKRALADAGQTAENTFFVTDTLGDIREAAAVGMRSIAVTWGFHPETTLLEGTPTHLVHTPDELDELVRALSEA